MNHPTRWPGWSAARAGLLGALLLLTGQCTQVKKPDIPPATPPPTLADVNAPSYGVNYNESLDQINATELKLTETKWVRGFLEFFQLYDDPNFATSPRIRSYLGLNAMGYRSWVNLKFDFKSRPYPAPNSAEWNNYMAFIDRLLAVIEPKSDVIVVGNEPFIESNAADQNTVLLAFYAAATERVNSYYQRNNVRKPIFVGAFDNLYTPAKQNNPGVQGLLNYIKNTPYVAGADIHIHHTTLAEINQSLDFLTARLRPDQRFLVSEFSLMKYWRDKMPLALSPQFLAAANASATDDILPPPAAVQLNYQYVDYALKNPRSLNEWNAFLRTSDWSESQKTYMCDSYKRFKSYPQFYLSAYAMRQNYGQNADFTATTDPWVLNSLIVARTVQLSNGLGQPRYAYVDQIKQINLDGNACP